MMKIVLLSFFFVVTVLFAGDKQLNGLNVVVKDLVIIEKTDKSSHPVKKLKQELVHTESSAQSLYLKIGADRAEKERTDKTKKDRIDLERSMKKIKK